MESIKESLYWLLNQLYTPLEWVLDGLVYVLKAIPWLILDGVLSAVSVFIAAVDVSAVVFQWAAGYALIPDLAIWFMVAIGFPQVVTLVASAYVVRFILNIVPAAFTRV